MLFMRRFSGLHMWKECADVTFGMPFIASYLKNVLSRLSPMICFAAALVVIILC